MSPRAHWIGVWVGARLDLDAVERRKIMNWRESHMGRPARRPSLYRLSYNHIIFKFTAVVVNRTENSEILSYKYTSVTYVYSWISHCWLYSNYIKTKLGEWKCAYSKKRTFSHEFIPKLLWPFGNWQQVSPKELCRLIRIQAIKPRRPKSNISRPWSPTISSTFEFFSD
jgi:hypothetical protein